MTKLDKRLQRIERNPRNVARDDLVSLLKSYGFVCRGGKGSHSCFKHPELPEIKLTIPRKLKPGIVKQALEAIYRLKEIEEDG